MKKLITAVVLLSAMSSSFAFSGYTALRLVGGNDREATVTEYKALIEAHKTLSLNDSLVKFITKIQNAAFFSGSHPNNKEGLFQDLINRNLLILDTKNPPVIESNTMVFKNIHIALSLENNRISVNAPNLNKKQCLVLAQTFIGKNSVAQVLLNGIEVTDTFSCEEQNTIKII